MGDYTNRDYFYGRHEVAAPKVPKIIDTEYEDDLIAEIKDLRAEVATLKATLRMVREVLATTTDKNHLVGRIIDALGDVR